MGLFRIKGIYHSGRKGLRMSPVTEYKYDGLVGCVIEWNINSIQLFQPTRFLIKNHPIYSLWNTSAIIQLSKEKYSDTYILETINTIYELEIL